MITLRHVEDLRQIRPEAWNALVGTNDPFVEHTFLLGLERSRSVGPGTGWQPMHLVAYEGGELVGALPLYAKDDSWGEYIFDFQWARAAQLAGIAYYPKLVSMVPFTPATGRRFLVHPEARRESVVEALVRGARASAAECGASSVHLLYLSPEERDEVASIGGYAPRVSLQFHWENRGYASFDAYLEAFRSPSRKQVRRERRRVAESGLDVRVKTGPELDADDWRALEIFYRMNVARHGSYPYLTPAFFQHLREHPERVVACLAYRGFEPVGGSLDFEKGAHLYGRYWGSTEENEMLHFECCYYQLIDRAIRLGMRRFEAGAQGHHKLKRGLLPSEIHSAHWVADARLARAIEAFLPQETEAVRAEMRELEAESPFRRDASDD